MINFENRLLIRKGNKNEQCIFLGRITRQPELYQTSGGKEYCRFTLAVDKDKETADFIPCVCWGENAQNLVKYVVKGQQLLVQGKMQSGSYQDASGTTRYTLDAFIYRIEFLAKPREKTEALTENTAVQPLEDYDLPF